MTFDIEPSSASLPTFKEVVAQAEKLTKQVLGRHKINLSLPVKANLNTNTAGLTDVLNLEVWWTTPEYIYSYIFFHVPPYSNAFGVKIVCRLDQGKKKWSASISDAGPYAYFQRLALMVVTASLAKVSRGVVTTSDSLWGRNTPLQAEQLAAWLLDPNTAPTKKIAQWTKKIIADVARYAADLAHPPKLLINEEKFWKLIAASNTAGGDDSEKMVKILHKKLMQLSRRAREEFDYVFDQKMRALDSKTLWRAAKELNGPVSDVGFEYFRAWVIAQGRQVYEQALNNADSILIFKGKRKAGDYELEELLTVTQS
jgi:hypothetical protein